MLVSDNHCLGLCTFNHLVHRFSVFTAHFLILHQVLDDLLVSELDVESVGKQSLQVTELRFQAILSFFQLLELGLFFNEHYVKLLELLETAHGSVHFRLELELDSEQFARSLILQRAELVTISADRYIAGAQFVYLLAQHVAIFALFLTLLFHLNLTATRL